MTPINLLRRLENAISSFLRHGKTGYIDISNVTRARTLQEMLIDSQQSVYYRWEKVADEPLESQLAFDGEAFRDVRSGKEMTDAQLEAKIAEGNKFAQGIGLNTLKRALLTKWARSATRREILEAARKFKGEVLAALSVLSVGKLGEKPREAGD